MKWLATGKCLGTKLRTSHCRWEIIKEGQGGIKLTYLNLEKISKAITGKGSRRTWRAKKSKVVSQVF